MATKKKKSKKSKSSGAITAEFGHKDAKGGGGGVRLPEGDYLAKIIDAKQEEASTGSQMIVWTYKILEGKHKGKKIKDRTVLVPKALFRLRNLLEALGVTVPEKTVKVEYKKYIGEKIGLTIVDGEEYKNKIRSEVGDFIPADQVGDDDDEDEDDEDLDDDDEDDDEDDDDEDDDDEDEDDDLDEVDLDEL